MRAATSPDPTASRHHGNAASVAAFSAGQATHANTRDRILDELRTSSGLTSKDLVRILDRPIHAISGRLSELKRDGLIRGTGQRIQGAEVLTLIRKPHQLSLLEVA